MTPFEHAVLDALKRIPSGKVTTYALLARHLNSGPRAVGNAVAKNPDPSTIPCHRVIRSDGHIGGYAFGGPEAKADRLRLEGIDVTEESVTMSDEILFHFDAESV